MRRKQRWIGWLAIGFCLTVLWNCSGAPPVRQTTTGISSFERAHQYLHRRLLPDITVDSALVPDSLAQTVAIPPAAEPLPKLEDFSLYGATPTADSDTVYIEIFSSAEKANADRQDERWLVDVAEAFNRQNQTVDGKTVRVGIRNVPSGLAAQLLTARAAQPTGYTPTNELWLAFLQTGGVAFTSVQAALVPNTAGFVVADQPYQQLAVEGEVSFDRLLDTILAGRLTIGYPNPYASSTALNLLYIILWRAAGRGDGQPLTAADLRSPHHIRFQNDVVIQKKHIRRDRLI